MLNKEFKQINDEVSKLQNKIDTLLNKFEGTEFEETRMIIACEDLNCNLDSFKSRFEYFDTEPKFATLSLNKQERYETEDGIAFTCGSSMEMLIDNEWELGSIEHDDNAYYFLSNSGEKVYLSQGMNIRHRK